MMRVFTVHAPMPRRSRDDAPAAPAHDVRLRALEGRPTLAPDADAGLAAAAPSAAATPTTATPVTTTPATTTRATTTPVAVAPAATTPVSPWTTLPRSSVPLRDPAPRPDPAPGTASGPADAVPLDNEALQHLRLVPEGFSAWALVFGPFWFLFRGLWLAALIWVAVAVLLAGLRSVVPVLIPYAPWMTLALVILTGFHARDVERWTLRRRGLRERGVVLGFDEEDALLRLGTRAGALGATAPGSGERRA